jgi:hypothetical protein
MDTVALGRLSSSTPVSSVNSHSLNCSTFINLSINDVKTLASLVTPALRLLSEAMKVKACGVLHSTCKRNVSDCNTYLGGTSD